jgi:hypothetical protein
MAKNSLKNSDASGLGGDRRKSASDSDLSIIAQPELPNECETAVFYPSARSFPVPAPRHSHLEVTSVSPTPDPMYKASRNDNSLIEDNCVGSPDSLNSSVAVSKPETCSEEVPEEVTDDLYLVKSSEELPNFVPAQGSDASVSDSIEEIGSLNLNTSPSKPVKKYPVGILKKSNRDSQFPHTNFHMRSKFNYPPLNFCGNRPDPSTSSKSQKKVRFSDEVEVSVKNSSPMVMNMSDSVQIELWKRVFPKEFSPNSAFTPKLRCSLSSKAPPFQGMHRGSRKPPNISVHVPAAAGYNFNTNHSGKPVELSDLLDDVEKGDSTVDQSSTDTDINTMWDQIRLCLQDGRKVSVPPRLFDFKPPVENSRQALTTFSRPVSFNAETSAGTSVLPSGTRTYDSATPGLRRNSVNHTTPKHLVYRQPNQGRLRSYSDNVHQGQYAAAAAEKEPVQFKNQMQDVVQSSRGPSHAIRNCDGELQDFSLCFLLHKFVGFHSL